MLRVSEIFRSVQGEGLLTGIDSVFLRTSGCNLRCQWCDTDYASWIPEGPVRRWEDIAEQVDDYDVEHIVITGGEPLLPADIVPLSEWLHQRDHHITFETAATVDRPVACDLMSISPKRANSTPVDDPRDPTGRWNNRHEQLRHQPNTVNAFLSRYGYQFKFVCATTSDVDDVVGYLKDFPAVSPERVLLMPEGCDTKTLNERLAWLEPLAKSHGFGISKRLHVELFGNARGT